ncbi:MAG: ABC transporter ATP-binding protein, partial [Desulfobulbia bacterium]
YGDFQALFGVSVEIREGEVVAVIGANGAGKSTLMNSIAGLIRNQPEMVLLKDDPIGDLESYDVVSRGVALVPEGRRLFPSLTVEENLIIGGQLGRSGRWSLRTVYELFPALGNLKNIPSTSVSGGQQQMVAIGRALMSNPDLLLFDEISLGLAPVVIQDIYRILPDIIGEGQSAIIVEQDIHRAMAVCDRLYCFQDGRVSLEGYPQELSKDQITKAYFGV